VHHSSLIGTAAQYDAGNAVPAAPARLRGDALAVLAPIEAFDLPDVRHPVREPERQDVLHCLLAEEVVDAEDLRLVEDCVNGRRAGTGAILLRD
jgi:hypothetical protein